THRLAVRIPPVRHNIEQSFSDHDAADERRFSPSTGAHHHRTVNDALTRHRVKPVELVQIVLLLTSNNERFILLSVTRIRPAKIRGHLIRDRPPQCREIALELRNPRHHASSRFVAPYRSRADNTFTAPRVAFDSPSTA